MANANNNNKDSDDDDGPVPAIMELELLEPEMWFRRNADAAEKVAEEIAT